MKRGTRKKVVRLGFTDTWLFVKAQKLNHDCDGLILFVALYLYFSKFDTEKLFVHVGTMQQMKLTIETCDHFLLIWPWCTHVHSWCTYGIDGDPTTHPSKSLSAFLQSGSKNKSVTLRAHWTISLVTSSCIGISYQYLRHPYKSPCLRCIPSTTQRCSFCCSRSTLPWRGQSLISISM